MEKRYTIGVMIGNANSPHTMNLMQGIFHAAKSMDVNVLFFLGFTVVIQFEIIYKTGVRHGKYEKKMDSR